MLSAIEIDSLRSQGVSEEEIVLRNGGPLPFASFGEPEYAPMGTAMAGDEVDMGFSRDANGNPIINPDNLVSAQPVFAPAAPSQEAIDAGIANDVNDPAYIQAQQQREQQQVQAQQSQAPVVQQQAEQMNGVGGPDTPVDNGMQGFDPIGSFMGGFASSQAPAYSGGLQAIAAAFGGGSQAMQRDMAANRRSLNSDKFGNTPIPYTDENGNLRMGRMAPNGSMIDVPMPGGGAYIKPDSFIRAGDAVYRTNPYGGGAATVERPIQYGPGESPEDRRSIVTAEKEAATAQKRAAEFPDRALKFATANDETESFIDAIDYSINDTSYGNTGLVSLGSFIPGTPMYDMARQVDRMGSFIVRSSIASLKAQGGTFGAISEKELELLKNSYGIIDTGLTPKRYKQELGKIRKVFAAANRRATDDFNLRNKSMPGYKPVAYKDFTPAKNLPYGGYTGVAP